MLVHGLVTVVLAYILIKRLMRRSLPKIRGPKSPSFIFGNLLELNQRSAGEADFEWQRRYGDVVRFRSVFGRDELWVADPKALQHIFNSYAYVRASVFRVLTRMLHGRGIVWSEGEDHKRHRKILLPGFGSSESKAFLGIFKGCAEAMCERWMDIVRNSAERRVVFNLTPWLARATMDIIGQAVFDTDFGTIHNDDHPLQKAYSNSRNDIFGRPTRTQIFLMAAAAYIPPWILEWMTDNLSNPRLDRARQVKRVATEFARELVREKAEMLLAGKESRDVFSLLIKANMDAEAKNKLTEEELLAQMRTILSAGHDTTVNTLSWILLELARRTRVQSKLRAEIRQMNAAVRARGDAEYTIADFEAMCYTTAVIKEGIRFHPVVTHAFRTAAKDDVLPFFRSITTESGEVLNEMLVPKGMPITVSIVAYNRNKELWGEDAHEFNPDRWLNGIASEKKPVSVGVYSNLMTFTAGHRSCLGWRFAVIEIQAFLVEILSRFELAMTERSETISRGPPVVMVPVIEGELERGSQLPLAVSIVPREDDRRPAKCIVEGEGRL